MTQQETLTKAYELFNERKVDALLELMAPDVAWANGWEGGYVHGRDNVKDYWLRQWNEIDPEVKPVKITPINDGRLEVLVSQTVKDLHGNLLFQGTVKHIYAFTDDLIKSMEIDSGA
jgi:hypothetical protein